MTERHRLTLETGEITASAPCRIDMGGTLDMITFHYPLGYLEPCTFNIAIALRTTVTLRPYRKGMIKVSSKGFQSSEFPSDAMPFEHPLGLMFAISAYFNADGIHIDVVSESPPRSALGGSSVAAVSLVSAFLTLSDPGISDAVLKERSAAIAFLIESSIAGGTCGIQDHLAAAYGGIHVWYFEKKTALPAYRRVKVVDEADFIDIEERLTIAFCGIPHESENVNGKWIKQFLTGTTRDLWIEIIDCTHKFVSAIREKQFSELHAYMNRETEIRRHMTPDVLDDVGNRLVDSALSSDSGVRFTGAGGGGCIWALSEKNRINELRNEWREILETHQDACFLESKIDPRGVRVQYKTTC